MQKNNRDFSFIKSNIIKYLDLKGISKYECYQKTGITNGVLSQQGGMSEENTVKFLSYYRDINIEWLITGEGPMLKTDQQIGDISNSTVVGSNVSGNGNQITHNDFAGMIELQKGYQQLLNRKDEQINRLLTIIENAQGINEK